MAANDDLRDDILKSTLAAFRVSAATNRKALDLLKDLETELIGITSSSGPITPRAKARFDSLLARVSLAIDRGVKRVSGTVEKSAIDIGDVIAGRTVDAMNGALGADLASITITRGDIAALVNGKVIQGTQLPQFWDAMSEETKRNYEKALRTSMLMGETNDQIIATILGNRGATAILDVTRARATALVRTSVMSVNNEVLKRTYAENSDLVKEIQHLSTLDGRTSFICIARDGLRYRVTPDGIIPVGHDKQFLGGPPYHPQCRSVMIPILPTFAELAKRKIDGKKFDTAFQESLAAKGFDEAAIADIRANQRASMSGPLPRSIKFEDFATQRGKGFLDDVLGPGRANLYLKGKIDFTDLIDARGGVRTIDELRNLARVAPRPITPRPKITVPRPSGPPPATTPAPPAPPKKKKLTVPRPKKKAVKAPKKKAPPAPPARTIGLMAVEGRGVTKAFRSEMHRAFSNIEKVHAIPDHGAFTLERRSINSLGEYRWGGNAMQRINVSPPKNMTHFHPLTTLAHEYGHLLDRHLRRNRPASTGWGTDGLMKIKDGMPVDDESHPLAKWWRAIKRSNAFSELTHKKGKFAQYQRDPKELWARSYAQYIAEKSGDPVMLREIREANAPRAIVWSKAEKKVVEIDYDNNSLFSQWEEADFAPIRKAFDEIFKELK